MNKPTEDRPQKSAFPYIHRLTTRWSDNDVYGHVNNVAYYSFFDTAVNAYLIAECDLDIHGGGVIGLVVETGCKYFASLEYPEDLEIGVRVARMGNSSVVYEIGVFRAGEDEIAALGRFVHVYVDRDGRRPTPLPEPLREGLSKILVEG